MAETAADDDASLHRIAKEPRLAVSMTDLPRILDVPESDVPVVLAHLIDRGLVCLWPDRLLVALTPLGAARIDVIPVPDRRGRFLWQTRGSYAADCRARAAAHTGEPVVTLNTPPRERKNRRPGVFVEADLRDRDHTGIFDEIPDLFALDTLAVRDDEDAAPDAPALARVFYGVGLQWPVPHQPGELCKACRHKAALARIGYCILCDRTGAEAPKPPSQKSPHVVAARLKMRPEPAVPGLAGGTGSPPVRRSTARKRLIGNL